MDKLNKIFKANDILTAAELNSITNKIDAIIDDVNTNIKIRIEESSETLYLLI